MPSRASFFRKFLRQPSQTGAVSPASLRLSHAITRATQATYRNQINGDIPKSEGPLGSSGVAHEHLKVMELGAGTGALSEGICRLNPILVERDQEWARLLVLRFPHLEVRAECATHTLSNLSHPVGIVTSIPLINNPQAKELKTLMAKRYAEGLIRFCVLYTYGWSNPLAELGFRKAKRESFVAMSLPPAFVWTYE